MGSPWSDRGRAGVWLALGLFIAGCDAEAPGGSPPSAGSASSGPVATVGNGAPNTHSPDDVSATPPAAVPAPPDSPSAPVVPDTDGFASAPIEWALPRGPSGGGFNGTGGPSWFCMDLDGDALADLVWTGLRRGGVGAASTMIEPWIASGRPHWRVYRNTGDGFERDATSWRLPPALREQPGQWTLRNETHSLFDVDGDERPDLVLTGRYDPTTARVEPLFDDASRVEWRVFINRGDGFAGEPRRVRLPESEISFSSQLSWIMLDMDGDELLDVVVQGSIDAAGLYSMLRDGQGRPHWRVYRNTSTPGGAVSFSATPLEYALPTTEGPDPGGDATWFIDDLDGDDRPDLTRTGTLYGGGVDATGAPVPYHAEVLRDGPRTFWRTFPGGAAGFGAARELGVPEAGHKLGYGTSLPLSYSIATDGEEVVSALWSTFDLDGDGRAEIVDYGYAAHDGGIASWGEPDDVWWKVYRQDEHGFGRHYDRWRVPAEVRLIGPQAHDAPGTWLVTDLTGDGVIDLVLPSVWTATREGPRLQVRADEGKPYWVVYPGVVAE